jgi:hypothetical protein
MRSIARGCQVLAALVGAACIASAGPAAAATADDSIQDAQARWHFRHVDSAYLIDGHPVLCVQKSDGHWDFWDPRRDVLLGKKNLDCLPPTGSRTQDLVVHAAPFPGMTYEPGSQASFNGASTIWAESDDPSHCALGFDHYFTATPPRGEPYSFYVIGRLSRPRPVDLSLTGCGLIAGVTHEQYAQGYDVASTVRTLDIGEHRTLLMTTTDAGDPVVLVLVGRPATAWTNGQGVLVVPATVLQPRLQKAGVDYPDRERVVAQLMQSPR